MGTSRVAPDPSVADYRATSPQEWGGKPRRYVNAGMTYLT
ncbi:hypothetical protein BH10PSE6_BH10PSE6_17140 [soil metagenome]